MIIAPTNKGKDFYTEKYKDLENQVVTKLGRNNIYNIKDLNLFSKI